MPKVMDQKTIETVDSLVSGYNKAKNLYQENKALISNLKLWFQKNKTKIIIAVVILAGVAFYVYRQYQQYTEESLLSEKKPTQTKKTAKTIEVNPEGAAEVIPEN